MKSHISNDFNPRSREGSDLHCLYLRFPYNISIHAPARGATPTGQEFLQNEIYFNPRSREGSDAWDSRKKPDILISIHAPARGATPGKIGADPEIFISIHAPARGATASQCAICRHGNFNPRSREGSDSGAGLAVLLCFFYFNPRSREGSDRGLMPSIYSSQ